MPDPLWQWDRIHRNRHHIGASDDRAREPFRRRSPRSCGGRGSRTRTQRVRTVHYIVMLLEQLGLIRIARLLTETVAAPAEHALASDGGAPQRASLEAMRPSSWKVADPACTDALCATRGRAVVRVHHFVSGAPARGPLDRTIARRLRRARTECRRAVLAHARSQRAHFSQRCAGLLPDLLLSLRAVSTLAPVGSNTLRTIHY